MNFKFFEREPELENRLVYFQPNNFQPDNVEFCFQFGDDEPIVFASGPNVCHITLNPTNGGNMTFNDNGRVFKLFARERI